MSNRRSPSLRPCHPHCEDKKQLVAKASILRLHLLAMDTQRKEAIENLEAMTQAVKMALLSLKAGAVETAIQDLENELGNQS